MLESHTISAKSVMQNLIQMDNQSVDMSGPLRVFLPSQNSSGTIEFGTYRLYEVVQVGVGHSGLAQLTVHPVD